MTKRAGTDAPPHHVIEWVEFRSGFLAGTRLELVDGLNCLIGARGNGKTTVLELVRYGLGAEHDEGSRETAEQRKLVLSFAKKNLDGGSIRIGIRTKHGARYTVDRTWDRDYSVVDGEGRSLELILDRDETFPLEIYSAGEMPAIAGSKARQLDLLDRFIDVDSSVRIDAELRRLERELDENGTEQLRRENDVVESGTHDSDVIAINEQLKALEAKEGPDAGRLNAAHAEKSRREQERRALEQLGPDLERLVADHEAHVSAAARRLDGRIDRSHLEGPNAAAFRTIEQALRDVAEGMRASHAKLAKLVASARARLDEQTKNLTVIHAKEEQDYQALVAKSQEAQARAAERLKLQQRLAERTVRRHALEQRRAEKRSLQEQRQRLLARLAVTREERLKLRQEVARKLTAKLGPEIVVEVAPGDHVDQLTEFLAESVRAIKGRAGQALEDVARAVDPMELAALVATDGEGERLAARCPGLGKTRAKQIIAALRGPRQFELDRMEIPDVPTIKLLHGTEHKPSEEMSLGQRGTVILSILLLESERPLIIDQPEDNLDNSFIMETVVDVLRETGARRQIIFATHNANVAVLGEGRRVFVMESNGKKGWLEAGGTVDEVKEQILKVLEGGRDAFDERARRYGESPGG